jgi:fructose-1,6-bisphosphatase/inositol monophosphatase family enzyme
METPEVSRSEVTDADVAVDGTTYFAHRIPIFATLLAYEDEHGPALGVELIRPAVSAA